MDDEVWVIAARSYLAAFSKRALIFEGAVAYEGVLLEFDALVPRTYGAIVRLDHKDPTRLFGGVEISIECVEGDPCVTELVFAKLDDAWAIDHASDPPA